MTAQQLASAIASAGFVSAYGTPDTVIAPVLSELEKNELTVTTASREDRAVAMALGAALAGQRSLVFLKNAGLGYALDAILSVARPAGLPICLLVGGAGLGSDNLAHHVAWGQATVPILAAACIYTRQVALDRDQLDDGLVVALREGWDAGSHTAIVVVP